MTAQNSNTIKPKKNISKIILWLFGILFCSALFGAILIPALVSTRLGNEKVQQLINSQINGHLDYEQLQLEWFGEQKLEKVILKDSKNQEIASLDSLVVKASLWKLMINKTLKTPLEFSGLNALIAQTNNAETNIQQALSSKNLKEESETHPLTISLKDVNGLAYFDEDQTYHLQVSGETLQNQVKGSFDIKGSFVEFNKSKEVKNTNYIDTEQLGHFQVQAHAKNFPVELLDDALSVSKPHYKGLLIAALGKTLDLDLSEFKTHEGIELKLNIQTPFVKGLLNGLLKNDRLVIEDADSVQINVQPQFVDLLSQLIASPYQFHLKNPASGQLNLAKVNLIFNVSGKNTPFIDLPHSFLKASFNVDHMDLDISQPIGAISLKHLNMILDASDEQNKMNFTLDGQLSRNQEITQISLKSHINKSFKIEELSTLKNTHLFLDVKGLPMTLLQDITGQSPLIVDALGQSVDAQASFTYETSPVATLKLNSDVLKMDTIHLNMYPHITLMQPVKIDYLLPSSLVNKFILQDKNLKLSGTTPTQITLNQLKIPSSPLSSQFSDWQINAVLNVQQLKINDNNNVNKVVISEFNTALSGNSLAQSNLNLNTTLNPIKNSTLGLIIGEEMNVNLDTSLVVDSEGRFNIHAFQVVLNSDNAQAKFLGRMENAEKIYLTQPASLRYRLTPANISLLGLNNLKLEDASQIHISIDADKKDINFFDSSSLKLKGLIKVDQVNLYGNAGSLQDLSIPWEINGPENTLILQAKSLTKLHSGKVVGSLDGLVKISQWLDNGNIKLENSFVESQVKLVNFPTAFLEKITQQDDLTTLVGQAVNIDFSTHLSHTNRLEGTVQFKFHGNDLNGQGVFTINNGIVSTPSASPIVANMTLTPDRFQAFRKRILSQNVRQPEITLMTPSRITLNISSLSFPLEVKESPLWLKARLSSQITIDNLRMQDKNSGSTVWLTNMLCDVNSPELANNISFSLNGEHRTPTGSPLPFTIAGRAQHSFTPSGELNRDNLALLLDTKIQQFPVRLLGNFLGMTHEIPQRISAVLGDSINADVHVQIDHLQGPVVAHLSGNNGSISLDATLKDGFLTLNKNFHTQVALTPEFGKYVLEDIFPLASGLIGAENPLTINVDAKGFVLPIKNFNMKDVRVSSASLELGKVRFKKEGQLGSILSLFNHPGNKEIPVWFTPLYMSMQSGVIQFQRMDMLIMNLYPIATWGTVDLPKDKVNMIIGLTAQALNVGLNIPGLNGDYILQIPFKGTINNASIDKKKATAKIAAHIASNRGPEGLFIGTALHIAAGGLTEEQAPPPTTNPLPWSTASSNDQTIDKKPSGSDHPLHKVEDKASSLLRNLLPF